MMSPEELSPGDTVFWANSAFGEEACGIVTLVERSERYSDTWNVKRLSGHPAAQVSDCYIEAVIPPPLSPEAMS